jgi:hypothetical protein
MIPPRPDDPQSPSIGGSSVDPAMIDAYTSALLRGEVGNPENWLLHRAQGKVLAPSALTTFRTLDMLVRNRGLIGTLWSHPVSDDETRSTDEFRTASTPVMSDPTEPAMSGFEWALGHMEDRAWLLTHQLEPLGYLDVHGGGMGVIALAWHTGMKKEVVLKVANKPYLQGRFHREIEVHAKIGGNANIVVARTPLDHRGTPILVVDYVRGLPLGRWVELNGPMPWPEAARCVRQAALGLGHAHAKGVIHRDVKPSNLIRSSRDGVVSVIDWGLALDRERRDEAYLALTTTGQMLGTPLYCPPEQAEAPSDATPASDLYGLGCVWYELMTGKPPFPPNRDQPMSLERLKAAHANEPVPPLPEELGVPESVEHVLRKLLDKNPDRRYPSAEGFIADLDQSQRKVVEVPIDPKPLWVKWVAATALLLAVWLCWPKPLGPSRIREVVIEVVDPEGKSGRTGKLGSAVFEAYSGEEVTIRGELTAPGYAYLIAFQPDGQMELCSMAGGDAAIPDRIQSPSYPPPGKPSEAFGLKDGEGLQAFALVLSRAPLPSFRDWRASQGPCPWQSAKKAEPGVVWRFNGQTLESLKAGGTRGTGTSQGARGAVAELAEWLKSRPGVDEVVVEAFAVLPTEADPVGRPQASTKDQKE